MSNQLKKTQDQAGPSNGIDRANNIIVSETPNLVKTESTQAPTGCEALEAEVRQLYAEFEGLARTTLRVAYRLGSKLTQLKAALKQGSPKLSWETYVEEHLGIRSRSASNYMRIHREASTINGIAELLKSETVSEIGIREALDVLAERKAKGGDVEPGQAVLKDKETKLSARAHKASAQPGLRLADGRQIKMERLQWVDGLVPRSAIESWVSEVAADSADPERGKIEARRQRVVIQIAAGINRACGKAEPSSALELVESSLDAVRMILRQSPKA
jgi:hypothetical protein